MTPMNSVEVLLVEDDPADVELTREGLKDSKMMVHLSVVDDGVEAMKFLRYPGRGSHDVPGYVRYPKVLRMGRQLLDYKADRAGRIHQNCKQCP